MEKNSRCHVCGESKLRWLLDLRSGLSIHVCDVCTNAITIPVPSACYEDHGFYQSGILNEEISRSYMTPIVQFVQRHVSGGKLLDVGTGAGLLIEEALKLGFDAEGLEASKSAVRYCKSRGLRVRHGNLEADAFRGGSFDVIVMSHVLEHISDPLALLGVAHQLLGERGVVCLSQTNYQGTVPRLLGRHWQAWVPTEHLVHFSPAGIADLLSRAGFEVLETRLLPLGYVPDFKLCRPGAMVAKALNNIRWLISKRRLGFPFVGDQMYVLARKRSSLSWRSTKRLPDSEPPAL